VQALRARAAVPALGARGARSRGRERRAAGLILISAALLAGCGGGHRAEPTTTTTAVPTTTTTTAATTTTAPTVTAPPPPTQAFSWQAPGALVWHETDVDPEALGRSLRESGFGWAALYLHDGLSEDPVDPGWIDRFRRASGLPLGGWGVLRADPEQEAALADALLARYGLSFYIADAEGDYEFSGQAGPSDERSGRSRRFVAAFRARRPDLPAGLSSYCRPDMHDIDWRSWRSAGFVFLPQAYVNQLGAKAAPAVCVKAAAGFFGAAEVHPTIGMYGAPRAVSAERYAALLAAAGIQGFSVYPAEVVSPDEWRALGPAR
jgi:hypothetical protein